MAGKSFVLTGDAQLNRRLAALKSTEAKKVIRQASRTAMKRLLPRIKAAAPYETGALRKSLKVRAIKRTRLRVGTRIVTAAKDLQFGGKKYYSAFQEFGTQRITALHWFEETAERNKERIVRFYRWNVKKNLEALANKTK